GAVPPPSEVPKGTYPPPGPRKRDLFLYATTHPTRAVAAKLEPARGGLVVTRRAPLRVEARAEGDDFRLEAATAVADQLADWGYEVDPAAGRTLRLTFDRPTVREEFGDPEKLGADAIDVLTVRTRRRWRWRSSRRTSS